MLKRIILLLLVICSYVQISPQDLSINPNDLSYLQVNHKKEMVDLIKHFEDYTAISHWDICAYRWGYGTTADRAGKYISEQDSFYECQRELDKRIVIIKKHYPNLTDWQTLVIASFKYNVNNFRSGLISALLTGDECLIAREMQKYTSAGGKFYKSLKKRREIEIQYLLSNGDYSQIIEIKNMYNI